MKISVLIPVYNVERYLSQCLNSVIDQTERDIEIICVDDCSTDGSLDLLLQFEKKDDRIRVIRHMHNMGLCKSRKDAVREASGEYIMFLDSDDYIEKCACEELYDVIKEKNVDVVQFGSFLEPQAGVSKELVDWTESFMTPGAGFLKGEELLYECFGSGTINCNLVNKIWKTSVCKKGYDRIDDDYINSSEDRYAAFVLLFYANSGYGLPDKKYYHYRMGTGVTGGGILSLEQFKSRCAGAQVCKKVEIFLERENAFEEYKEVKRAFDTAIRNDCVDCWYRKLLDDNLGIAWKEMLQYWDNVDLLSYFSERHFEEQNDIYAKICKINQNKNKMMIYYRYIGFSEMDPVIKSYVKANRNMDCVFVTDSDVSDSSETDTYLEHRLLTIPDTNQSNWSDYKRRANSIVKILSNENISTCIYLSPTSHIATMDRILIESYGVSFFMAQDEYMVDRNIKRKKEIKRLQKKYEELFQACNEIKKSKLYRLGQIVCSFKGKISRKQ